jgi:sensor histidine kinase YesM
LVENALQHAFIGDETGGKVVVSIKIVDDGLRITVKDNGVGIDESIVQQLHQFTDFGESVGLLNVHRRLLNLTGRGLKIESGPGQGTVVSFFFQKNWNSR